MGDPLTENYPPVPPAPRQPEGYPQQAPGPVRANQPPQYPQTAPAPYGQQPYPQQPSYGQQPYPQQPSYGQPQYAPYPPQQPTPQWAPAAAKPTSSGFRVAAGIVGIVLGFILLLASGAGFGANSIAGLLLLIAALGNITSGIVLLTMQRGKTRGAPITSISFAGFALLAALMAVPFIGGAVLLFAVILATPVLVVMGMGLSREMRAASPTPSGI
jgi:hypothetical protein